MPPVVYLLHFPPAAVDRLSAALLDTHYLGIEPAGEAAIDVQTARHGLGWRDLPPGAIVSDVWEADSLPAASQLLVKFQKQGSRARLCSICNPGNNRGGGRGNYERRARVRVQTRAQVKGAKGPISVRG